MFFRRGRCGRSSIHAKCLGLAECFTELKKGSVLFERHSSWEIAKRHLNPKPYTPLNPKPYASTPNFHLTNSFTIQCVGATITHAHTIPCRTSPEHSRHMMHSIVTCSEEGFSTHDLVDGLVPATWMVVKIMVPFWVPIIIRHLLFRVPKKGP